MSPAAELMTAHIIDIVDGRTNVEILDALMTCVAKTIAQLDHRDRAMHVHAQFCDLLYKRLTDLYAEKARDENH